MIKDIQFIHFLTATVIIEIIMLIIFKFTNFSSRAIINWYHNLGWTAILLDVLSAIIGFYISKFIYEYLVENNYLSKKNEFFKFLAIVLFVQILHDLLFYVLIIKPTKPNINKVIDEFKSYAKHYQLQAIFADSLIYITTTPILYYYIQNQDDSKNIFITILSFYLMGYLLHQKPIIN